MAAVTNLMVEVADATILPRFRRLREGDVSEKTPGEIVTIADREAEALLSARLPDLVPGSRVIGEEACAVDDSLLTTLDEGNVWLVDPLDGTSNFAEGHAPFSTMIALRVDGRTRAAWIIDPLSGRQTVAEEGSGTWINGDRVRADSGVLPVSELTGSILQRFLPLDLKASILLRAQKLERTLAGTKSAGAEYPAIVLGEQHFALFWRTLAWDHAPGALIVSEAGGKVARLDGSQYDPSSNASGLLAARSAGIWDKVQRLLIEGDAR